MSMLTLDTLALLSQVIIYNTCRVKLLTIIL